LLVETDGGAESVSTGEATLLGWGHIWSARAGVRPPAGTIKMPVMTGEGGFMLWTVVAILVILWLLGALGTVSLPVLSGNTVHLLLVIVIIIVIVQLLQRRRL